MIGLWLSHCPQFPNSPSICKPPFSCVTCSLLGSAQRTRSRLEGWRGRRDLFPFCLFPNLIFSSMTHSLTCCWCQSPGFPIIWALWGPSQGSTVQEEYDLTRPNYSFRIQLGVLADPAVPTSGSTFCLLNPQNLISFLHLVATVMMGDIISVFSTRPWLIQHSCK